MKKIILGIFLLSVGALNAMESSLKNSAKMEQSFNLPSLGSSFSEKLFVLGSSSLSEQERKQWNVLSVLNYEMSFAQMTKGKKPEEIKKNLVGILNRTKYSDENMKESILPPDKQYKLFQEDQKTILGINDEHLIALLRHAMNFREADNREEENKKLKMTIDIAFQFSLVVN